ncbi:hypothetical protein Q3O43_19115 [Rhodococcus aetherivorans]|uniref:hypothetical protein n=1 Tax=Rhodococcus aetherivorans TaxID=191292 RepID=UPI0026EE6223|nr:hypothetical protein [Rhodococcus aetherivorans]WKW97140.1 hypothetical protein Q3O43_19115 [Rhodococcus aetherivorans]
MLIIFGLVVLLAAVIIGMAGVLGNTGAAHALTDDSFVVFGYHVTGSTGALFLYGIVVGAIGAVGLSLLLAGAQRTSRRGRLARRELKESRLETTAARHEYDRSPPHRSPAAPSRRRPGARRPTHPIGAIRSAIDPVGRPPPPTDRPPRPPRRSGADRRHQRRFDARAAMFGRQRAEVTAPAVPVWAVSAPEGGWGC